MSSFFFVIAVQAYSVIRFLFNYMMPVLVFAYCYLRILHTIRRQNKVSSSHRGSTQATTTAGTSRDENTGQIQQQATGTMLSHTELNVIKIQEMILI